MWSALWRKEMSQEDSRGTTCTLDVCVFGNTCILNEKGKDKLEKNV